MTFVEGEAEVFGVVEICGNESVKLAVANNLEGADIVVPQARWDLDRLALKCTE